ncbi:MAG: hypothetical protein AAFX50_17820, partial [Acidobacteriota bacterium]
MTIQHEYRLRPKRIESPITLKLSAALGCAALVLTGCAGLGTPAPAVEPVAVPDAWAGVDSDSAVTRSPGSEELATWWRRLGDPVLDELVEQTLRRNFEDQPRRRRDKCQLWNTGEHHVRA